MAGQGYYLARSFVNYGTVVWAGILGLNTPAVNRGLIALEGAGAGLHAFAGFTQSEGSTSVGASSTLAVTGDFALAAGTITANYDAALSATGDYLQTGGALDFVAYGVDFDITGDATVSGGAVKFHSEAGPDIAAISAHTFWLEPGGEIDAVGGRIQVVDVFRNAGLVVLKDLDSGNGGMGFLEVNGTYRQTLDGTLFVKRLATRLMANGSPT